MYVIIVFPQNQINNGFFSVILYVNQWSHGILMWELLTRGRKPYSQVDNYSLKQYLHDGHRLEKPTLAPNIM